MPRALDGFREPTLMRRADSADSPRKNLSAFGDEMPQKFPIFKVYVRDFFRAEFTHSFAPNAKPSLSCHISSAFLAYRNPFIRRFFLLRDILRRIPVPIHHHH